MKKSYLFVYNSSLGTEDEIRNFINTCPLISTWRKELKGAYFVVSEHSAQQLYQATADSFGHKGTYIYSEYSKNSQGLLQKRSWHLLNNKTLPPKE